MANRDQPAVPAAQVVHRRLREIQGPGELVLLDPDLEPGHQARRQDRNSTIRASPEPAQEGAHRAGQSTLCPRRGRAAPSVRSAKVVVTVVDGRWSARANTCCPCGDAWRMASSVRTAAPASTTSASAMTASRAPTVKPRTRLPITPTLGWPLVWCVALIHHSWSPAH
jgi:hypothetical protein